MIPKNIHILTRDLEILDTDTPLTRAWVSLNPHEDRTEYTDLSQVWHDAKEKPEKGKLIIGIDANDALVYKRENQNVGDWLYLAECFGLIRWAYIEDLLPKGGKL